MERLFSLTRALVARKRKIFALFFALAASIGLSWAETTVTWNNDDLNGEWGTTFSKDGVTLNVGDFIDFENKNFFGGGTFTTTLGNFTKIEVNAEYNDISGEGWSGDYEHMTWTGNASSVSFSGDITDHGSGNTQFVFTIGDPLPTYTVALEDGTANADKVTLSKTSAEEGATVTVTPNEEYEITDFSAMYNTTEELSTSFNAGTGAYSFTMPAANVTIEATIALKPVPEGDIFAGFTATAGSGGFDNEGHANLVDGKFTSGNVQTDWTKWCTNNDHRSVPTGESGDACWWIDFEASAALDLTGYILTTGNDSGNEHGRNPKNWVLKAKLNADDAWTTIATVTNDVTMKNQSFKDYKFFVDQSGSYKYFRFEVFANQGANVMQLCELRLIGTEAPAPAPTTTTTVTWDSNTLSRIFLYGGEAFPEGGVTLTLLDGEGEIYGPEGRWMGESPDASFKFSTSLGNFTRIEITATINGLAGSGWTETSPGAVWTGDANETTFGGYFENVSQIVFTIEADPTPAEETTTVTWNSTDFTEEGTYTSHKGIEVNPGVEVIDIAMEVPIVSISPYGPGSFSTTNSNLVFTKIEVSGGEYDEPSFEGEGWSDSEGKRVWEGQAATVPFNLGFIYTGDEGNIPWTIVFTLAPATPKAYSSGTVALKDLIVGDTLMAGVTLTDDSDSKVKFVPSRLKINGNIYDYEFTLASFVNTMQTPLLGENAAMTLNGGFTITPINEEGNDGNAWVVTEIYVEADIPVTLAGIGTQSGSSDEGSGSTGALKGKFSVAGDKVVYFSKGNLQYNSGTQAWQFAENQYDYVGAAEGNTSVTADGIADNNGTVDLFGWVGASSTWTGLKQYGITSSEATSVTDGYGDNDSEALKSDWGTTMGTGWFTLSTEQWQYLFNTRSGATVNGTTNARYTDATINTDGTGVNGIILFPDDFDESKTDGATTWGTINSCSDWGTKLTTAQWNSFEEAGCVFLPAAGKRKGTSVSYAGSDGYYWSSSPASYDPEYACYMYFFSYSVDPDFNNRYFGYSVRLVTETAPAEDTPTTTTTVTWDSNTISSINIRNGESFTEGDVTVTVLNGQIARTSKWKGNSVDASFKFSTSLGNFTRIEITATIRGLEGSGWTEDSPGAVWTGDANEITFGMYFKNVTQIVFTIEEHAPAPSVTLPQAIDTLVYTGEAQTLIAAGEAAGFTFQYKVGENGEYSTDLPTAINAGSYTVYYKATNGNEEQDITGSVEVSIAKAALTITAENKEVVYGYAAPGFSVSYYGLKGSDLPADVLTGELSYACDYTAGSNAGEYYITPSGQTSANYDITYVKGTLVVYKADPAFTAPTADTLTYNGGAQTLIAAGITEHGTFEYTFTPNDDESWNTALPQAKNAGEYGVYYRIAGDANHNDYESADAVVVTIAKAALTATADDKSVIYGDDAPEYTVTYEGWQGEDNADVLSGTIAYACEYAQTSNVGDYTIVPSGVSNPDYAITFVNGKVTVSKAQLTITADDKSVIYGDEVPEYTAQFEGFKNEDDETVVSGLTLTSEYVQTSNVGEYAIVPADATAQNYAITFVNGTLTVNKAALTITAENKEVVYGYAAPGFSVSYSGLKGSDLPADVLTGELAYACDYTAGSNAGEYDITPSGQTSANYDITYVNGKLVVYKADPAFTAPTADTLTYNGGAQTLVAAGITEHGTFEYTFTPNDDESWNTALPQAKNADTYGVYYRIAGDANHNDYESADAVVVTIAQAALTATADNKSVIYGDDAPEYTVTYEGWQGEDNADVLSGTIAYACEYAQTSNVGDYTIVPSGVSNPDYAITFVNGKVTVSKAQLTITADDKEVTYGDEVPEYTAQFEGFKNEDDEIVVSGLTLTSEYVQTSNVGEYAIVPADATAQNYAITFVNGTLTVNRAALMITAEDKEVTYGDEAPAFTVTYEGFKNEDDEIVVSGLTLTSEYVLTSNVGEYDIVPADATAQNYAISYTNGTLTVNQAPLTITAEDKSVIYGDEAPAFTAQFEGFKNEDDEIVVSGLTLTSEYVQTSNVGEYDIVPANAEAQNYAISYTNGTLTVNQAALTITAEDKTMLYGDEAPEFTVTYAGWKNEDDEAVVSGLNYTCAYAPGSYIGTYVINPNSATAQNYAITFVDGTLTVNKATVKVTGADIQEAKFEDGNTAAVVLNAGQLEGIKLNDPIGHVTTATFSDATVGEGKTITMFYELTGNAALLTNYNLTPTSEIFAKEGTIIENFIPNDNPEEKVDDETEVKEGIEVYAYGYCLGDSVGMSYHLNSGNPDQYKIEFEDSLFTDVDWTDLDITGPDGIIYIEVPVDVPTGDYQMTVTFRDSRFTWLPSNPMNVTFHVNLPQTYVTPMFDNTIALVDTCECFTDIQWYHRADASEPWVAIPGATGHYYRPADGSKLTGEFFVQAKMNGVPTYTCGQADMETLYGAEKPKANVKAFPNPVVNTTTVTIENSENYEHSLRIVNLTGAEMFRTTFEGNETEVDMDGFVQGNYMIYVDGIVVKVMKK